MIAVERNIRQEAEAYFNEHYGPTIPSRRMDYMLEIKKQFFIQGAIWAAGCKQENAAPSARPNMR